MDVFVKLAALWLVLKSLALRAGPRVAGPRAGPQVAVPDVAEAVELVDP